MSDTDSTNVEAARGAGQNSNERCGCRSGLDYKNCCGAPDRTAINAPLLASVSAQGLDGGENLTMELKLALDHIDTQPDWFPARVNFFEDKAYFVKMSLQWYRESVFLDPGRIKGSCVIASDLDWLQGVAGQIEGQPTGFIFHTAFCGSTLMSQALAAVYNSLPLREPEVLGNLLVYLRSQRATLEEYDARIKQVLQLLSRSYKAGQYAVVKANDYANPLMPELLNRHDLPVLFMYTPLAEFLAGCLKADNRREWIRQRFQSVQRFAPSLLHWPDPLAIEDDAYGEMAAVYWSYNIALFREAHRLAPGQVCSLDFNDMLADPLAAVQRAGQWFQLQPRTDVDAEAQLDGLFGVYSKNSQFKYSPQQRNNDVERILDQNSDQLPAAERLAKQLLGDGYPQQRLPAVLMEQ